MVAFVGRRQSDGRVQSVTDPDPQGCKGARGHGGREHDEGAGAWGRHAGGRRRRGATHQGFLDPQPVPSSLPSLPRRASPRLYQPIGLTQPSEHLYVHRWDFCCFAEHACIQLLNCQTTTPTRHTPVHRSPPDHIIIPPASPFLHISLLTSSVPNFPHLTSLNL